MAPPRSIVVHNLCKQPLFVEDHDKEDKTLLVAPNALATVQRIAKKTKKKGDQAVTTVVQATTVQTSEKGESDVAALSLSLLSRTSARHRHHRATIDLPGVSHPVEVLGAYCPKKKTSTVHLLTYRDPAAWMAPLPNKTLLSKLTLPGTHESCALYGWPISSCQSTSILQQLQGGIRFFDIRLSIPSDGKPLIAYHGIQPEYILFSDILLQVYNFLDSNPSECAVLSIKQENSVQGFEDQVYAEVNKRLQTWWLNPQVPTLGQVRGKVVMFSRFGQRSLNGIHVPIWPNNSTTVWTTNLPDRVEVSVQDWYDIGSIIGIPNKSNLIIQSLATNLIQRRNTNSSSPSSWMLNYMSASSPFLGFPFICAGGISIPFTSWGIEGINSRVLRWFLTNDSEGVKLQSCVVLCDFWESDDGAVVRWLIECNF